MWHVNHPLTVWNGFGLCYPIVFSIGYWCLVMLSSILEHSFGHRWSNSNILLDVNLCECQWSSMYLSCSEENFDVFFIFSFSHSSMQCFNLPFRHAVSYNYCGAKFRLIIANIEFSSHILLSILLQRWESPSLHHLIVEFTLPALLHKNIPLAVLPWCVIWLCWLSYRALQFDFLELATCLIVPFLSGVLFLRCSHFLPTSVMCVVPTAKISAKSIFLWNFAKSSSLYFVTEFFLIHIWTLTWN